MSSARVSLWASAVGTAAGLLTAAGCIGEGGTSAQSAGQGSTGTSRAARTATTATTGTGPSATTSATAATTAAGATTASTATSTTTANTTTAATTGATVAAPPPTGDLAAATGGVECNYIPHGSLRGADQLTVFFSIVAEPATIRLPRLVAVDATSDTGLGTDLRSAVRSGASTPVQLELRPTDFGRAHAITITVDSANEVRETDETNNRIRVSVRLPSPRPDQALTSLPCSAFRME